MTRRPFRTKPGEHGTLYLYAIPYGDRDPAEPPRSCRLWAYDREHAEERFFDSEEGFQIVGAITRVRETRS